MSAGRIALVLLVSAAWSCDDRPGWLEPLETISPAGEPGVVDVQHWDWLQADIERLIDQELEADAFRSEYLRLTIEFLEIEGESITRFEAAVEESLEEIVAARERLDAASPGAARGVLWQEYANAQRSANRHLLAALDKTDPRQALLREQSLRWVLRLDYGVRKAAR